MYCSSHENKKKKKKEKTRLKEDMEHWLVKNEEVVVVEEIAVIVAGEVSNEIESGPALGIAGPNYNLGGGAQLQLGWQGPLL